MRKWLSYRDKDSFSFRAARKRSDLLDLSDFYAFLIELNSTFDSSAQVSGERFLRRANGRTAP